MNAGETFNFFRPQTAASLLLIALVFMLTTPLLRAADFAADFEAANKLYEQGRFADAANAYDRIISTGKVSEALYFNRGDALFKLGQVGRAIAAYRQAELLAPRDSALRSNLQFARTRARGGSTYRADRWQGWLNTLSLNEWTLLTAIAFWMVFVILALSQWRPELKPRMRNLLAVSAFAVVVFGICLGIVVNRDCFTTSAIVVAGEAEVRNGPLDESPSLFKIRDGVELEVIDQKDNWLQVVDPAQRAGWIRQDQAILFEPAASGKSKSISVQDNTAK
jgi:tetratricopeptide (TPR) repeat protein